MPSLFAPTVVVAGLQDGNLTLAAGRTRRVISWTGDPHTAPDPTERAALIAALRELAPASAWRPRPVFQCGLPVQGVALRRFQLPGAPGGEQRRMAQLQVEAAFPLPPEELLWGIVGPGTSQPRETGGLPTVTVAAIRRAHLESLATAVMEAGLQPVFTLSCCLRDRGALAGFTGCRIDIGSRSADLSLWEDGQLVRVRNLAAGTADTAGAALVLRDAIAGLPTGTRVSIGGSVGHDQFELLLGSVPDRTRIERRSESMLPAEPGTTAGLPLQLHYDSGDAGPSEANRRSVPGEALPWLVGVGVMGLALILFPYAEAAMNRPRLQRQLAALEKDRARLAEIDRRLEFVQFLAENQPPYLDASYVVANAAPPGTKLDSVTMNRRGEISLAGAVQQPQQVGEFRSRLVDSRFFSSVVVEEQTTPQPGAGRATFRISAQWKARTDRETLQLGPELPKPSTTNTPATNVPTPTAPRP